MVDGLITELSRVPGARLEAAADPSVLTRLRPKQEKIAVAAFNASL